MIKRRRTRQISIGRVKIGGSAPISVQSMTKTRTADVASTLAQIRSLEDAGCEIVRIALSDSDDAEAFKKIRKATDMPLVADIHFDYRLALKAVRYGVDGLRINPGNIGSSERVEEVVRAAKDADIPIRIGVNAGSLEKDILKRHGHTPWAMVESAMRRIEIFEGLDFRDIKVSLKASDVMSTVEAYRILSEKADYPLHIGITEAGTAFSGTVKSAAGLGILLSQGIGDTLRVSLTGTPEEEVRVGYAVLKALGIRKKGVNIISCPTCGRVKVDVVSLACEVERRLLHIDTPLDVAVMGCVVNGPGEAVQADVGLASGDGVGLIYRRGEVVKKVKEEDMVDELVAMVEDLVLSGYKKSEII